MSDDARYMKLALELSRAQGARAFPNPPVGCVIVKDGAVVGRGATNDGGRPHAERIALDEAGEAARGADVYVTLEPCAHEREGGNCSWALIAAGVARVVIASRDPDPRTDGKGAARLREAGIVVEEGLMEREAQALKAEFFARHS